MVQLNQSHSYAKTSLTTFLLQNVYVQLLETGSLDKANLGVLAYSHHGL